MNDISLTVRLPSELNTELQTAAKKLGLTKTNLIRYAIHEMLTIDGIEPNFSVSPEPRYRFVLNVNQLTYSILEDACKKYSQSMNAVIIATCLLALKRSEEWLLPTER